MHKLWEAEPWRIEHADDAKITFSIALHGKHAWEVLLEDGRRYHSIGHGWATDNPRDWEDAIVPVLRQFFVKGRLGALRTNGDTCRERSGREHAPVVEGTYAGKAA